MQNSKKKVKIAMPAGRKRIPDNVHQLRGTHVPSRHGDKEKPINQGAKVLKTAPRDLSPEEKEHWKYFIKLLKRMGADVAYEPDEELLRLLVSLREELFEAKAELNEVGRYYSVLTKSGDEMRRANPAAAQLVTLTRTIQSLLSEFGLTPSARSRIGADLAGAKTNPNDRFFS